MVTEDIGAVYDRLASVVSDDAELAWVFRALRRASIDCRIPVFRHHFSAADPATSSAWERQGEKRRGAAKAAYCFLENIPEPEHA